MKRSNFKKLFYLRTPGIADKMRFMELEFIGVGEAFEPQVGNASYLVRGPRTLLIDCGYGVPARLFPSIPDPDLIDAIYLTHFHADHSFGIPAVLNRWNEDNRKKPLTLIGQPGTREYLQQVIDLAYPSCRSRLRYDLTFTEESKGCSFHEYRLEFGKSEHSVPNYAVKITAEGVVLGISGDGGLTEQTRKLFHSCQVLVHEAFGYDVSVKGHTHALEVMEYARTLPQLRLLALTHLHREDRRKYAANYQALGEGEKFSVMIPSPGDRIKLT